MRTRAWLCGAVFGCGLAMAVPPVAPMSGPVTSEEMVEPGVREYVVEARTLLEDSEPLRMSPSDGDEPLRVIRYDDLSEEMKARFSAIQVGSGNSERVREFAESKLDEIKSEIGERVDAFHKAASEADFDAYFALMHDDGVFLGTDASERWTKAQFMDYARPFMVEQGKGWAYTPRDRHVSVHGDVAWFDELIENEKYGTLRGQGVLVREGGAWKVAQYSYSFAVPNDKAAGVVELILSEDGAEDGAGGEP